MLLSQQHIVSSFCELTGSGKCELHELTVCSQLGLLKKALAGTQVPHIWPLPDLR